MIPYFTIVPSARERELMLNAFDSSWWSGGYYVNEFEKLLEEFFECGCLTTSNGTTAITLAYLGLDLKPGDEIIVPGFGFMAAANVAVNLGLVPVFVDVKEDTWCMDEDLLLNKFSNKTKAVVPIHTYGVMCEMPKIVSLCREYNVRVIEDCAESFDAGKYPYPAGTYGDIGILSFQATKTITTGEGGAVLSRIDSLITKMRYIREHGLAERGTYNHILHGMNFRLPNILAAIGVAQMETVSDKVYRRIDIANYYKDNIKAVSQFYPYGTANWVFAFRSNKRDQLIKELGAKGIQTRPGFTSPNFLPIYSKSPLPISDMLSKEVISLPTYPELKQEEIDYICQTVNDLI